MNVLQTKYEQDFYNWSKHQIDLLKVRNFDELDIDHLIEELEDMGKSTLRELESRLIILIAHLLKWQFQLTTLTQQWQEFEGKSWRNTIIEQRTQILFLLKKVPSLKSKLEAAIGEAYPEGRTLASKEAGLPKTTFPEVCPYSVEQLLDDEFYPESN
jgi:hypothetical protein